MIHYSNKIFVKRCNLTSDRWYFLKCIILWIIKVSYCLCSCVVSSFNTCCDFFLCRRLAFVTFRFDFDIRNLKCVIDVLLIKDLQICREWVLQVQNPFPRKTPPDLLLRSLNVSILKLLCILYFNEFEIMMFGVMCQIWG